LLYICKNYIIIIGGDIQMKYVLNSIYKYFKTTDTVLFVLTIAISLFGMIMIYSATLYLTTNSRTLLMQSLAILIGICVMVLISKMDYHTITNMWKYIAAAAVLLLIFTLIFGSGRAGIDEKAWIKIAGLSLQPSELVKIAFILTFAKHIDTVKENINSPINVVLLILHACIPIGFIIKQGDMGMTLVFVFMFICMMFAGNLKLRYFVGAAILGLIAAPIAWLKLGTRQTGRILALFDPASYPAQAWQQTQGRTALASGELWGYGLFHGPKTQSLSASALSERQNDMIFSVIGEELGFIGCITIVLLLLALLMKILLTARASKDLMGSVICIGVFSTFAIQMVANIGMCLSLMPVIGLTLPFLSSGGTSLLSAFMAMGLVLSVKNNSSSLLFSKMQQ
jgi:rod shape determining protein RodA